MCPATLGTLAAVAAGAGGAGGIVGGQIMTGALMGLSTTAAGVMTGSTILSGVGAFMSAKARADEARLRNKQMYEQSVATAKASNASLEIEYGLTADRQREEQLAAAEELGSRQRVYNEAMGDVTASAAETGTTGINLDAIRRGMDMSYGRGNVTIDKNLLAVQRQLQMGQLGLRAKAVGRQLAVTPRYTQVPSAIMAPLLTTAGFGASNLAKFGGEDWLSGTANKLRSSSASKPKTLGSSWKSSSSPWKSGVL